jgi:hypothetical protein
MDRKLAFLHDPTLVNKSLVDVDIFHAIGIMQPQKSSNQSKTAPHFSSEKDTSSVALINRIDDIIDKISTQAKSSTPPLTKFKSSAYDTKSVTNTQMRTATINQPHIPREPKITSITEGTQFRPANTIIHNPTISPQLSASLLLNEIQTERVENQRIPKKERREPPLLPALRESRLESLKSELEELKVLQIETKRKLKNSLPDKLAVDPGYINKQIEKEVRAIKEAILIEEDLLQGRISEAELVESHLRSLDKISQIKNSNMLSSSIDDDPPKSHIEEKLQQTIQDMKEKLVVDLFIKSNSSNNLQQHNIYEKSSEAPSLLTKEFGSPTPPPLDTSLNIQPDSLNREIINETEIPSIATNNREIVQEIDVEAAQEPTTQEEQEEYKNKNENSISRTNSSYSIISEASETSSANTNITHDENDMDVPSIRLRQPHNEDNEQYEKASANSYPISGSISKTSSENPFFITRSRSNSSSSANSFKNVHKEGINTDSEEETMYTTGTDTDEQENKNKKEATVTQASLLTVSTLSAQQGRISRSNSTSSTGEEYQLPPDMYMPAVPPNDLPKLKNYFLTGGAVFTVLLHKKDKGKEMHVKATLEFPDREVRIF